MKDYKYERLTPFKWFVLQNFPFLDVDFDAITNYQLFCKLGEKINQLIESQNNLGIEMESLSNSYNNLVDYVNDYFDNLDVQDEIDNKLDDMAEAGELQEIITAYLQLQGVLSFNTVADMVASTNIIEGSTCRTLGKLVYNDGLGRFYKIEHLVSANPDGVNLINLGHDDLYARLIIEQYLIDIGTLSNLNTQVKSSLVGAINEITNYLKEGSNSFPAGTTFHILAGTIRQDENDPTSWYFLNDSNHERIGFTNVVEIDDSNYYVEVHFDQTYDKVVSFVACPDNTLASNAELSIGASVGLNNALISIGTSHGIEGEIYYDSANSTWVDSLGGSVSFSNGIVTLTPNSNLKLYSPIAFNVKPMSRGYNTYKLPVALASGYRLSFFDSNGDIVTTPSEDLSCKYVLGGNSRAVRVNQDLGESSNIWIIGIMAKYPPVD